MNKMMRTRWLALAGLMVLAVGCAQPPQQEMDAAKAALAEAESAEADKYASAEWSTAQQAMNAAQAEVEAQNAKFALFRSYGTAKELIADATAKANQARDAGAAGKEKARNEAQAAADAARAAVENAQTLLASLEQCRRKPKGFAADLEALKGSVSALAEQVGGIDAAFSSEDFLGAKASADALRGQAETLATDIGNAKTKIGCS